MSITLFPGQRAWLLDFVHNKHRHQIVRLTLRQPLMLWKSVWVWLCVLSSMCLITKERWDSIRHISSDPIICFILLLVVYVFDQFQLYIYFLLLCFQRFSLFLVIVFHIVTIHSPNFKLVLPNLGCSLVGQTRTNGLTLNFSCYFGRKFTIGWGKKRSISYQST